MRLIRKNTIRFRSGNGRRGSVIVLVVAVLALLAVLGTVYIVSARSERAAANSGSNAANLDYAQRAVDEMTRQVIGEGMYDSLGRVGGAIALAGGTYGDKQARRHDCPEFNLVNPGRAFYNPAMRDESWLAADLYRRNAAWAVDDVTMPQTRVFSAGFWSPAVFNPATGAYDIPVLAADGSGNWSGQVGTFRVVANPLPAVQWADGTASPALDDGCVQMLPFSEANGTRYRYGIRILDTSRMANLNAGMLYAINMPSPQEAAGTYNADYSLISYAAGRPSIFNPAGTFTGTGDNPMSLDGAPGANNTGRLGMAMPPPGMPMDYWWNQVSYRFENPVLVPGILPFDLADELALRSYGNMGTLAIPRAAVGYTAAAQMWPNTLGNRPPNSNVVAGNARREFYSTYTYGRDLRAIADPINGVTGAPTAYVVVPSGGVGQWGSAASMSAPQLAGLVWPPFPGRVAAMPDISAYTLPLLSAEQAADSIVIAAVNIATAMRESGYSFDEQCAFAANYLTNRWNSWTVSGTQTLNGLTYNVFTLPAGPSFVDATGPCLRTSAALPSGGNFTSGLASVANKVYLGNAAQPFINEVAVQYATADGNTWTEVDSAIELYNPFSVALALDDFQIVLSNNAGSPIALTGQWIPPHGYFVLTKVAGQLDTTPTAIPNTAVPTTAAGLAVEGATSIYLMRRYVNRAGNPAWATVDHYGVTSVGTAPTTGNPGDSEIDFEARPNKLNGPGGMPPWHWLATVHDASVAEVKHKDDGSGTGANAVSLGAMNDSTGAATAYVPLYDRVADLSPPGGAFDPVQQQHLQRDIPLNINEFNKIMRICNEADPATGQPAGNNTVAAQIAAKVNLPDGAVAGTAYPVEASVRFDFRDAPYQYGGGTVPTLYPHGDDRANRLLSCLAFTDRLSDYGINLGDNTTWRVINLPTLGPQTFYDQGLSKLRLPGKINVNTASAEVLATIPVLASNPRLIGCILAYRWRTTTDDARIPAAYQFTTPAPIDFRAGTTAGQYPGYGIRSLGELLVPLWAYQVATLAPGQTYQMAYPTMWFRDRAWGAMYNALTVRSDTFVVYAYLEAVRQNPKYGGAFNNATDWYNNAAVTDDPNDPAHPLLRVARRRWVAIVDRSGCNYSRYVPESLMVGPPVLDPRFSAPRVVAEKDLPQ